MQQTRGSARYQAKETQRNAGRVKEVARSFQSAIYNENQYLGKIFF